MATVHILHGIHTSEPSGGVVKLLKPYFEKAGFGDVVVHSYGYVFAITTRWKNPQVVEEILPKIKNGDIVVGHSNGGTLAWMLAERGAPISGAVLINPALDANKALANQVRWVHVYFNQDDTAVWLSKMLLPFRHPWGEQGRIGYNGAPDVRYSNFDCQKESPPVFGHMDIFNPDKIYAWGPRIATRAWISHLNHSEK